MKLTFLKVTEAKTNGKFLLVGADDLSPPIVAGASIVNDDGDCLRIDGAATTGCDWQPF